MISLFKKLRSLNDIYHYFLGNYRYKLYYYRRYKRNFSKPLTILLRTHIEEQIEYRIAWMDIDCYNTGSCKLCGCATTALQCANKPCDKPCYPAMMTRGQWRDYKKGGGFRDKNGLWLGLTTQNLKPTLFKETTYGFKAINQEDSNETQSLQTKKGDDPTIQRDYGANQFW